MNRVPSGMVLTIDGTQVTVLGYLKEIDCYRVSYDGPGHIAGRALVESAYDLGLSSARAVIAALARDDEEAGQP